jgi:hypothetical protein
MGQAVQIHQHRCKEHLIVLSDEQNLFVHQPYPQWGNTKPVLKVLGKQIRAHKYKLLRRRLVKPVLEISWVDDVKLAVVVIIMNQLHHPDVAIWVKIPILLSIETEHIV